MKEFNEKELKQRQKMRESLFAKMSKVSSKPPRSIIASAKSYSTGTNAVYSNGTCLYATDSFALVRADVHGDDCEIELVPTQDDGKPYFVVDVAEGGFKSIPVPVGVGVPENANCFDGFLNAGKSKLDLGPHVAAWDANEQKRVLDCFLAAGISQVQIAKDGTLLRFHGINPDFCLMDACIAGAVL